MSGHVVRQAHTTHQNGADFVKVAPVDRTGVGGLCTTIVHTADSLGGRRTMWAVDALSRLTISGIEVGHGRAVRVDSVGRGASLATVPASGVSVGTFTGKLTPDEVRILAEYQGWRVAACEALGDECPEAQIEHARERAVYWRVAHSFSPLRAEIHRNDGSIERLPL